MDKPGMNSSLKPEKTPPRTIGCCPKVATVLIPFTFARIGFKNENKAK